MSRLIIDLGGGVVVPPQRKKDSKFVLLLAIPLNILSGFAYNGEILSNINAVRRSGWYGKGYCITSNISDPRYLNESM